MSAPGVAARSWALRGRTALPPLLSTVRAARPRQWLKNGLVVAAPAAAGTLANVHVLAALAVAFAAFCLAASGTYLVNDVRDVELDRRHPDKRRRPVAARELRISHALAVAAVAMAAALALSADVGTSLLAVVGGYLALTTAYSLWLRRIAWLDIGAVAGCFLLRAAAGGAAAGVPLSGWFLAVVALGASFVALGRRYAEAIRLGDVHASTRATLRAYRPGRLRVLCPVLAAATAIVYGLWAVAHPGWHLGIAWAQVSIVPFAVALARYAGALTRGHGESPERVAVTDPVMILAALGWISCFTVGTYLGD
jgi:decaprenyl-phosphate phosphoribosyltransferase